MQDAVHAHNHSVHRSIKCKPGEVTPSDVCDIREEMSQRTEPTKCKDDTHVNEIVRFKKVKMFLKKLIHRIGLKKGSSW